MKNKIISAVAAAIATTLATAAFAGGEKEVKLTMDQVPAVVQATVKAYAAGAEIKGIEDSDVDGTKVIEFDLVQNGKASEVAFRPDGRLFSTEASRNSLYDRIRQISPVDTRPGQISGRLMRHSVRQ